MTLQLRKRYNVNGNELKLVRIDFKRFPHKRKGYTEYVFRDKRGKSYTTLNVEKIQEIENER